jgi:hypothetical protein
MANQAIALQARAPQGDPLGGAIRGNAQMINMMAQQQAAQRQNAIAEQTMQIQRQREARETAMAGPQLAEAQSKAGSAQVKYATDFFNASAVSLSNAQDAQQAVAVGTRLKQLFPEPAFKQVVDQSLASIPQDPAQFPNWREQILTQALDAKDRLEQVTQTQDLGGSTRVLTRPKYGSAPFTVAPGSEAQKTMTPAQANPAGKLVQDEQGNYVLIDTRGRGAVPVTAGGGGIPAGRVGAIDPDAFKAAIVQKESGGDYTALSPKGAMGAYQVMPATAKTLAGRLGLPWNANLMRSNTPQGRQYQDAIGNAAIQEALQAGNGDVGRAAAYYHGGSDESQWKGKTQAYARDIVASLGGGGAAPAAGGAPVKGPVKGDAPTVPEQSASYNINRVLQAATEIQRVTKANPAANAPSAVEATVGSLPLISQGINFTRSSDRQIVAAAQRDLLDGLLYLATGAAYNKEQLQGQMESYIPSYSDKAATVKSKRDRLTNLIATAKSRAGRAWTPQMDAALNALTSGGGQARPPAAPSGGAPTRLKFNPATGDFD